MNNTHVDTNLGTVELKWKNDGKGIVDKAAVTAFEWGHCHSFAYEMHDLTGWPIIGIGGYSDQPAHYVNYDPRIDEFVDIRGAGAMARNAWMAEQGIRIYPPNVLPVMYRPIAKQMAEPFVKTILAELAKLPTKHSRKQWNMWMQGKKLVLDEPVAHVVL